MVHIDLLFIADYSLQQGMLQLALLDTKLAPLIFICNPPALSPLRVEPKVTRLRLFPPKADSVELLKASLRPTLPREGEEY